MADGADGADGSVIYETKGRIAYITINRPEALNALNPPTSLALTGALADFRDDPDLWIAILTSVGDRAFCSGADIKVMARRLFGEEAPPSVTEPKIHPFGFTSPEFGLWKPIIAAVHGFALGAGAELALACDMIVAADTTRFGIVEGKLGFIAAGAVVHRLPRQVPLKLAAEMILTSKHITAEDGYRMGLFNKVVPREKLMEEAELLANDVLKCSPIVVQAAKQAMMMGLDTPLAFAHPRNYEIMATITDTEDLREGISAFVEKREPHWEGR